ncbi:hypothetical protein NYO67_2134 [Aspergillus flavus]|nr:hypothetical protein NYO67_2134 [Aspergillus flavus]
MAGKTEDIEEVFTFKEEYPHSVSEHYILNARDGMANSVAALDLIQDMISSIYVGIRDHRIDQSDLGFWLQVYRTYLNKGDKALVDLGLRDKTCYAQAQRLFDLHGEVATWLGHNGFRKVGGEIAVPSIWVHERVTSFKEIVDVISKNRDRLRDELDNIHAAHLGGNSLSAEESAEFIDASTVENSIAKINATVSHLGFVTRGA